MNQVFKIGEQVIALTDSKNELCQPRKKGCSYTVQDVLYCPFKGVQYINIGPSAKYPTISCDCGRSHSSYGKHWTYSKHFIRPEDIPAAIEEAVEKEDYEMAALLKSVNPEIPDLIEQ